MKGEGLPNYRGLLFSLPACGGGVEDYCLHLGDMTRQSSGVFASRRPLRITSELSAMMGACSTCFHISHNPCPQNNNTPEPRQTQELPYERKEPSKL